MVEGISEDGCCVEGMAYWKYGFFHFTLLADIMKKYTKGKINYFEKEKVMGSIILSYKGKPIYTLNTITATIKQVPALVRDLDEAERSIAKEIAQNDKARGSQTKSIYEDM